MCGSGPSAPTYSPPPTPKPVDPMVNPEDASAGVNNNATNSAATPDNQRRNLRIDLGTNNSGTGLSIPT